MVWEVDILLLCWQVLSTIADTLSCICVKITLGCPILEGRKKSRDTSPLTSGYCEVLISKLICYYKYLGLKILLIKYDRSE